MKVIQSPLQFDELGHLTSYEISGEAGEVTHEYLRSSSDESAKVVITLEAATPDMLTISADGGAPPQNGTTVKSVVRNGVSYSAISLRAADFRRLSVRYYQRDFRPADNPCIMSFALFRPQSEGAAGIPWNLVSRFGDKCKACRILARFLINLIIAGGIDEEIALEGLKLFLPDAAVDALTDSEFLQLFQRLLGLLKRYDPRNRLAQTACKELNFCR